jgi:hypothetical protein
MVDVAEHQRGLVSSFVLHRFRARLILKPDQLLDELCHVLPSKLDARRVVGLGRVKDRDSILGLLESLTLLRTGVYLGVWSGFEVGEHPLEAALDMAEHTGGAAVSLVAGELVYYVTEHPDGDRYLLVRDEKLRQRAADAALAMRTERDNVRKARRSHGRTR